MYPRNISVSYRRTSGSTVILKGLLSLTRTWIKATDSDGLRLTVQTQADGVVSGVAQSLPLLRPITACHWALGAENVNRSTQDSGDHNIQSGAKRLNSESSLHPCLPCFIASGIDAGFQPAYLRPRSNPPLGGTGVSVAGSARLRPVVVTVLVVDDACGVVVQRLNATDRADLHPRFPAGLAAVLPLLCHPAGEQCKEKRRNTAHLRIF